MDELNILLDPLPEHIIVEPHNSVSQELGTDTSIPEMDSIIRYLNILEGYKARIKNLHWAAFAMNIHLRLDELLDIVSAYQDNIAEEAMGIYGQMNSNVINGEQCIDVDPLVLLENLKIKTFDFYKELGDKIEHAGLRSETENFIHNLNKYLYLFRLCKG